MRILILAALLGAMSLTGCSTLQSLYPKIKKDQKRSNSNGTISSSSG